MQCGVRDEYLLSVGVFAIDSSMLGFFSQRGQRTTLWVPGGFKEQFRSRKGLDIMGLDFTELYHMGKSL